MVRLWVRIRVGVRVRVKVRVSVRARVRVRVMAMAGFGLRLGLGMVLGLGLGSYDAETRKLDVHSSTGRAYEDVHTSCAVPSKKGDGLLQHWFANVNQHRVVLGGLFYDGIFLCAECPLVERESKSPS